MLQVHDPKGRVICSYCWNKEDKTEPQVKVKTWMLSNCKVSMENLLFLGFFNSKCIAIFPMYIYSIPANQLLAISLISDVKFYNVETLSGGWREGRQNRNLPNIMWSLRTHTISSEKAYMAPGHDGYDCVTKHLLSKHANITRDAVDRFKLFRVVVPRKKKAPIEMVS